MSRQTFVLAHKKTFRRNLNIFLLGAGDKLEKRNITFTTEHKVTEKDRNTRARKIAAEFSTSDERMVDAMYRDSGYGITFTHKDDPKGERKKESFNVKPLDAKRAALRNLFKAAKLEFDANKSVEVLTEEYHIHIAALSNVEVKASAPTPIPHEKVNIEEDMENQAEKARESYFDKYGEEVPEELRDDKAFLSALSDPNWDAKAYIAEKLGEDEGDELPNNVEKLKVIYFDEIGKNVPNPKSKDIPWIKDKILERRSNK